MSTLRVHVESPLSRRQGLEPPGEPPPVGPLRRRRRRRIVVGKTAVAPKNLDPEWGEAFQVWVPGAGDANVELRIVDRDLVTDDESMGAVNFAVPRSGAAPFAWRPVAKTADCKNAKGDLFCAAAARARADAAWTLTVHGAKNLPAADAGGTSDPFAVVEVEDEGGPGKGGSGFDEVGRTAVAWKTLQPTWDHAVDFDAPAGLAPGAGDPRDLKHLLALGPGRGSASTTRTATRRTTPWGSASSPSARCRGTGPRSGCPSIRSATAPRGSQRAPRCASPRRGKRAAAVDLPAERQLRQRALDPLDKLLPDAREDWDVVAAGLQESTFGGLFQKHAKPQEKPFDDDGDESDATRLAELLPGHEVVADGRRGEMRLVVLCRRALAGGVSCKRGAGEHGPRHVYHNKGGMVCAFALNGKGATTLAFFNAHLAAHEGKALRRDADVAEILGGCRSKLGGAYSSKLDVSAQVDYAMFVGDLNYRVLRGSTDALRSPTASPAAKRTAATFRPADDELSVEMAAKRVFVGWAAPPPAFAPTFKVAKGGGTYNAKRAPSWCDRVLVHESAALKGTATVETFDARPAVASSDHKPVAAVLVAVLAPGGGGAAFRRGREPLAFDAAVAPGAVVHVAFSTDDRPAGAASLSLADVAAAVDADGAYAVTAPLVLNGLQDRGDVALTFAAA
ncbi:hypothetical protein JL722_391 [Aureococcus anophagefferens]|nr:hypothetical protein JL722_391 [Aureococcus anophagefferens]